MWWRGRRWQWRHARDPHPQLCLEYDEGLEVELLGEAAKCGHDGRPGGDGRERERGGYGNKENERVGGKEREGGKGVGRGSRESTYK